VSFHGGLDAPLPADAPGIRSEVLVLHGAEDPYAPMTEVRAFEDEMRAVAADWQVVLYSGAVHSFTDPDAGSDPSKGAAYDPRAAKRSWEAMKNFLREILKP
jgi:dienelactone hydrolase